MENLSRVRAFVEAACLEAGAEPRTCFDLKLAVDEACANIVEHGYPRESPGTMRVAVSFDGERLTVAITDRGRSFDPSAIAPPDLTAGLEERASGGLGWHLIRSMVDEVAYRADAAGGNCLTLVKRLRRPEDSETGEV